MKGVIALKQVQRRFTKQLPGMSALTYHQQLVKLRLESLGQAYRRTRLDLVFAYKVVFNLVDISHSRQGHRYKLYVHYGKTTARYNYFSYISRIWNALPLDDVDFE